MASRENSLHILPRALTIAGFDPSGGAGVLADARTFTAFGFKTSAAITSITYQNTARVFGAIHQTGEDVRAQVLPLLEDAAIACAKTGMLPTREVVSEVARLFRDTSLPTPVVDPVIMSTSGQRLMEENAIETLIDELLSLARLVTPNIPEAEQFTGLVIASEKEMREAAAKIRQMGARAVLIKGGHLKIQKAEGRRLKAETEEADEQSSTSEEAIDILDNEGKVTVFRGKRILDVRLHGSGCILSAAIAAGLGKGMSLEDSVGAAKSYVLDEIRKASRRRQQAQLQGPHTGAEA